MNKLAIIAQHYSDYRTFLKDGKHVQESPIILHQKKNRPDCSLGTTGLSVPSIPGETHLVVDVNELCPTHFGIKIRCFHFSEVPCFRFDADGCAHNNISDDIPLKERQVTTPHFHRCGADGVMLAYKTETLLKPQDAAAIRGDMNFAMAHFCQEANIRDAANGFPAVRRHQDLLPTVSDDPLDGVTFEHGN